MVSKKSEMEGKGRSLPAVLKEPQMHRARIWLLQGPSSLKAALGLGHGSVTHFCPHSSWRARASGLESLSLYHILSSLNGQIYAPPCLQRSHVEHARTCSANQGTDGCYLGTCFLQRVDICARGLKRLPAAPRSPQPHLHAQLFGG